MIHSPRRPTASPARSVSGSACHASSCRPSPWGATRPQRCSTTRRRCFLLEKLFGVTVPNVSKWRRGIVGDMTSALGARQAGATCSAPSSRRVAHGPRGRRGGRRERADRHLRRRLRLCAAAPERHAGARDDPGSSRTTPITSPTTTTGPLPPGNRRTNAPRGDPGRPGDPAPGPAGALGVSRCRRRRHPPPRWGHDRLNDGGSHLPWGGSVRYMTLVSGKPPEWEHVERQKGRTKCALRT